MALLVEPLDSGTGHNPMAWVDRANSRSKDANSRSKDADSRSEAAQFEASRRGVNQAGANEAGVNEAGVNQPGVNRPSITGSARYLLPSVTDLLFILLFAGLCYGVLASRLLDDSGIGWHIRNGQNILATHQVPHTDPFSVTMQRQPWFAWEWLYDLRIAMVYNHVGLNGVVLVSAFVIALTLALVFRIALARGGSVPATFVLFLLCIVTSSIHFLARPHILGWLITIVWFWILDSATRTGRTRRLFLLPVLMLLWANVHGGFVTGLVLIAIFFVGAMIATVLERDSESRRKAISEGKTLAAVFALSALASLINPYGYHLHQHVYDYLSNRFFMQHIEEFRGPLIAGLPEQFFAILLVVVAMGVVAVRGRLRWSEWLVIAFSAFSGLYAARNLPVASMLLVIVAAPLLSRGSLKQQSRLGLAARLRAFSERITSTEWQLKGHLWPIAFVFFSVAVCFNNGKLVDRQLMDAHFREKRFPVHALAELERRGIQGPIFSLDYWGGFLIYNLYPNIRVIVDDRHDLYGEQYLREYLRIIHVEPGWEAALARQNAAVVLMAEKSKLTDALKKDSAWKLTFEDETAAMFEKR